MDLHYINRIGVEVEGGWNEEPARLQHDGSVSVSAPYRGESISPPISNMANLERFIEDNYPDISNSSCGLHVHLSFVHGAHYSLLMDREFQQYFLREMESWGRRFAGSEPDFWARIRGGNRYCLREWQADSQAKAMSKQNQRYCHWNFCYRLHGTAECRLLPVFKDVELAKAAVRKVISCSIMWIRGSRRTELANPLVNIPNLDADAVDAEKETIKDEICA